MNRLVRQVLPISSEEFAKMFRRCRPPSGWSETIAVSNSGGPDSTCLLFLINRFLSENAHMRDVPRRAVSIHINHDLQASAASMAEQCAESAKSIGVEHFTYKIPWSKGSWPHKPNDTTMESDARNARYRILNDVVTDLDADIVAMGHHLDDQIETSLMRVMKGSTPDGAAGMKCIRRWGMGFGYQEKDHARGMFAYEGMRRWIIRPLLSLPKDRIYATCNENKLSYVTDPTNSDDTLTIRNSVRKWLSDPSQLDPSKLPPETQKALDEFEIDISGGKERVYPILQELNHESENIDQEGDSLVQRPFFHADGPQVDSIISRSTLGSPAGTYLISCPSLTPITDPKIRRAFVLRILRYVSFRPWGSLGAQVNRRRHSLDLITENLWYPNPLQWRITPFCAGGGVAWQPVVFRGNRFKMPEPSLYSALENNPMGWLASRQVPLNKNTGTMGWNPLTAHVTEFLRQKLRQNAAFAELAWDNRFLVTFDLTKMPSDVLEVLDHPHADASIRINSRTRWFWPVVLLNKHGASDEILHFKVESLENDLISELHKERDMSWKKMEEVQSSWITTRFIRALTSL
ncbi:hypothetical protein D9758_000902 [Tetrapyrgos nigripes]|uniref:tRNA(Ile)-lysidine synthetase n=1 Tax=Tetrapyrgos nigripes TaxID=182062 RepID=A0A8H5GZ32_9AGAR|nr:hypothetical protein D9758_000902 [Tetrapyrgos nigripes]